MPLYLHLTPACNVPSILKQGLRPTVGPRSTLAGEQVACWYAFADLESMQNALMNWLGEAFEETQALALLAIDGTGLELLEESVGYEVRGVQVVPPSALAVVAWDVDGWSGELPQNLFAPHRKMRLSTKF